LLLTKPIIISKRLLLDSEFSTICMWLRFVLLGVLLNNKRLKFIILLLLSADLLLGLYIFYLLVILKSP